MAGHSWVQPCGLAVSGTGATETGNQDEQLKPLGAVKEFCTRMVRGRRATENPIRHLQAIRTENDVRRKRRALASEEFQLLIEAARSGKEVQCVSGPDRAVLNILAPRTRLHRNQLTSLTVRSLPLDSEPATLKVEAASTKRRREDVLPLHEQVVAEIRL